MASLANAALCALVALVFWSWLGYALGRALLPRALALGMAPVLGWAVHSALALPVFMLIGFSRFGVIAVGALCILIAGIAFFRSTEKSTAAPAATIPAWAYVAAAALAAAPAMAILPKVSAGSVQFADPIFDHAKAAIIDAMVRLGVPPIDPVFHQPGTPDRLAYYYLWHFSAAELALTLSISGWEADIGSTWFAAFASLSLMMAMAVWVGKRSVAALWVVVLACAGSLWLTLSLLTGTDRLAPVLWPPTGMAGWLFQAAWVPQHLMSATCVVAAMLLVARYAERRSGAVLGTLVLVVVAGYESSTYVGGVTFAIAALAAAPILLVSVEPGDRLRFVLSLAVAAVLVVCLAAPFIIDQSALVAARGDARPIAVVPLQVLGEALPRLLRRVLDIPAYWLILLPIELPASYVAGALSLSLLLRRGMPRPERLALAVLACLAGAGLVTSWLLVSTLSGNNDLGLRAILPAELVLIMGAAVGLALVPRRPAIVATALGGLLLSLPNTVDLIRYNAVGDPQPGGDLFAQGPKMWAAVRRYAAPTARVVNNPLFLQHLTPWPVNISWALLADRSSCFAGEEMAVAYSPLSPSRRQAVNAQFVRVFAGKGNAQDVADMATKYGCDVIVIVPQDAIWNNDPFAASSDYRLAENREGRWRIYVRRKK